MTSHISQGRDNNIETVLSEAAGITGHNLRLNPETATELAKERTLGLLAEYKSMGFSVRLSASFPNSQQPLTLEELCEAIGANSTQLLNVATGTFTDVLSISLRGIPMVAKVPGGRSGYDLDTLKTGACFGTFHMAGDYSTRAIEGEKEGKFSFFPKTFGVGSFIPNSQDPSDIQTALILVERLENKSIVQAAREGAISKEETAAGITLLLTELHDEYKLTLWDVDPHDIWVRLDEKGEIARTAEGTPILTIIDQGSLIPEKLAPNRQMQSKETAIPFVCQLFEGELARKAKEVPSS